MSPVLSPEVETAADKPVQPCTAQWPLSFQMSVSVPSSSGSTCASPRYWSHELYQGPQKQSVEVFYGRTKQQSDEIAKKFSNEKVLGFDTEFKAFLTKDDLSVPLQHRISLLQIACEDKIALLHLGQYAGSTPDDLIGPELRKIIERPDILKVGGSIRSTEYNTLVTWFELKPQGFFELSHLHKIVAYDPTDAKRCSRDNVKLEIMVEQHLGFPLQKDEYVRKSRWWLPLNTTQKRYAAADAYAGFMLYHCMNAKRMAINPQPPLPICVELYCNQKLKPGINLRPIDGTTEIITALAFFEPPEEVDLAAPESSPKTRPTTPRARKRKREPDPPLVDILTEQSSSRLYSLLLDHREETAEELGYENSPYLIAENKVLRELSLKCPRTKEELVRIKGVKEKRAASYGDDWLSIISDFLRKARPSDYVSHATETTSPTKEVQSSTSACTEKHCDGPVQVDVTGAQASTGALLGAVGGLQGAISVMQVAMTATQAASSCQVIC